MDETAKLAIRNRIRISWAGSVAILSCMLLPLAGCAGSVMTSGWNDERIVVDGDAQDWDGTSAFYNDEGVAVKVRNDAEYLYLLLVIQKREVGREVIMRGLTLWFDPNGGEKKTIGLRYPLG
ncbi:MAG: hypothetical protein ACRDGA_09535, partial [Bacteroidota bacterium]